MISPILLRVLSTFRTLCGLESLFSTSWSSSTVLRWIKFSVAPLSSRASFATLRYCDDSFNGTLIDLFLAMYSVRRACPNKSRYVQVLRKPISSPPSLITRANSARSSSVNLRTRVAMSAEDVVVAILLVMGVVSEDEGGSDSVARI